VKERSKGAAVTTKDGNNGFSLISNDKLLQLYRAMVKCRILGERVRDFLKPSPRPDEGETEGQREAAVVGVASGLQPEDTVVPARGDFSAAFIHGVPLDAILSHLMVKADLASQAKPHSTAPQSADAAFNVVLPTSSIAGSLDFAIGAAQAAKREKKAGIVAIFSSDESLSADTWHEALTIAGDNELPILFVRHNNFPSGLESRGGRSQTVKTGIGTQDGGPPKITVEGADAVAVHRVATEAIAHARKGNRPSLIECVTEHSINCDPLSEMETYLASKGLFNEKMRLEVTAGFKKELDAAIAAARRRSARRASKRLTEL
jgi:pyruvate dehydrogenase E1 component alpha subunit